LGASLTAALLAIGVASDPKKPGLNISDLFKVRPKAPTELVQEVVKAHVENQAKRPSEQPGAVKSNFDLIKSAQNFSSLSDFKQLKLESAARRLIDQMEKDEFSPENPFYKLSQVYPIALILSQGVQKFERAVYRTSE